MLPFDLHKMYETKNGVRPGSATRRYLDKTLNENKTLKHLNVIVSSLPIRYPSCDIKIPYSDKFDETTQIRLLFKYLHDHFALSTSGRDADIACLKTFFANLFCNSVNLRPYKRSDYDRLYIAGDERLASFYEDWPKNDLIQPRLLVGKYSIKDLPAIVADHLFDPRSCLIFTPHIKDFCEYKEFTCEIHGATFRYSLFDVNKAPHPRDYAYEFVEGINPSRNPSLNPDYPSFYKSFPGVKPIILVGRFIPGTLTECGGNQMDRCPCMNARCDTDQKEAEASFLNYAIKINFALKEACALKNVPYLLSRMLAPPICEQVVSKLNHNILETDVGSYYRELVSNLFLYEPISSRMIFGQPFEATVKNFPSYAEIRGCGFGKGVSEAYVIESTRFRKYFNFRLTTKF